MRVALSWIFFVAMAIIALRTGTNPDQLTQCWGICGFVANFLILVVASECLCRSKSSLGSDSTALPRLQLDCQGGGPTLV